MISRGSADTSIFIAREAGRPLDMKALPDQLGRSIVMIGELRAGVLATGDLDVRERRLASLTEALAMEPIPVDDEVARAWAKLRIVLRDHQLRMPLNDSWIAATAWSGQLPVVTQDVDYVDAGFDVIKV